jgi:hypothetical protein
MGRTGRYLAALSPSPTGFEPGAEAGIPAFRSVDHRCSIHPSWVAFYLLGCHLQKHVMDELGLIGPSATDFHPAPLTTGYRRPIRQCHRRMVIVPPNHKAPAAVPYWKPRANGADSSLLVENLSPKARWPLATFDTHDASPQQSVPAGESPPETYGVPKT